MYKGSYMSLSNILTPSIMCIDWTNTKYHLDFLTKNFNFFHFDIIDGFFAKDFALGSSTINSIRERYNNPAYYHFMVEEPSRIIESYKIKKGDIVVIHQECSRNLHRDIVSLKETGAKVGIALCPATPLNSLDYIIEEIDILHLMTVNPGFIGQPFVPKMIDKIKDAKEIINKMSLDFKISVDGNVSFKNIPVMLKAGADILVLGSSSLFKKDKKKIIDLESNYNEINCIIKEIT